MAAKRHDFEKHAKRDHQQLTRGSGRRGFLPSIVPISSVVSMKLLFVISPPSHKHLSRIAHHSDPLTSTASFQQFHGRICTLACPINRVVRLMFDGSRYTRRWCWFATRQPRAVQHYSQVFWVGCDLSPVIVQHSLTLEVFVFRAHFEHCPDFETDFLWEVGLDQVQRMPRSSALEILHVYLNENIQPTICKELWCCVTPVETLLFSKLCHVPTQRVPERLQPYNCFRSRQSTEVGFPNAACCPSHSAGPRDILRPRPTWKYALVTSVVNVLYDFLRLK